MTELLRGDQGAVARRDELRRTLTQASTSPGDLVAVPAHASRELVDVIKACGRRVVFAPVDAEGATDVDGLPAVAAVWHQTAAGIVPTRARLDSRADAPGTSPQHGAVLVDAYDTVVVGRDRTRLAGLELALTSNTAATIAAQRQRWQDVWFGLMHAAGLPLLGEERAPTASPPAPAAIPSGVVVRLPAGCDPTTFVAYAQAERTGVEWLPSRRPLHPQARLTLDSDQLRRSIDHLARLVVVPVGPTMTDEEIGHAVLGIVKAAEYTGWRWHLDPQHARQYAASLLDRYGPDHEAYRPAFPC